MAQAALLNLQGTQLTPGGHMSRIPSPNFGASPLASSNLGLLERNLPPPIGYHNQQALDEYPGLRSVHTHHSDGLNSQAADYVSSGLRIPSQIFGVDDGLSREMLQMRIVAGGGLASTGGIQAQNGYTEVERLLLQMHEQKQRELEKLAALQQQVLASQSDVSPPDLRADAGLGGLRTNAVRESGRRLMSVLPTMSEEDFHATAKGQRSVMSPDVSTGSFSPSLSAQSSQLSMDLDSRLTFTRQRNQTHAEARAQAQADLQAQTHHIRSTTVPSQYFTSDRHNSPTFPSHSTNQLAHLTTNSAKLSLHDSDMTIRDMTHLRGTGLNNSLLRDPNDSGLGRNSLRSQTSLHSVRDAAALVPTKARANSVSHGQLHTRIDTSVPTRKTAAAAAMMDDDDGSGLDSPALSYTASVRTPASLSPATPFSAFGETFDGPASITTGCEVGLGVGVAGAVGKQRMRVGEPTMGLGAV